MKPLLTGVLTIILVAASLTSLARDVGNVDKEPLAVQEGLTLNSIYGIV